MRSLASAFGLCLLTTVASGSENLVTDASFELALFDEDGKNKLASFGHLPLDGNAAWQTLTKAGVRLEASVATARLGLVLTGPQLGARVEVDCLGLFRLEAFATLAKACVQAKRSCLPDTMLTYVNYSPPTSGGSWTERGTDPFLAHRGGGMEKIWANGNNSSQFNGSFTHWALAHAGYDADFLAEEDIEAGQLARYKVLYLDGPQLHRRAAQAIRAWVQDGGVLFGSAGAASRDQYDHPTQVLEKTFAARSRNFAVKASAGRPKFELRALKSLQRLKPSAGPSGPATEIDQLCYQEHLEVLPGAEVILLDGAGRAAGTLNRTGRGIAIRVAALPGISYAHEAVQPPYDPDEYLPRAFREALRDFLAWPARLAGAAAVAQASSPIAEIVRYDGPDRAVVFVIDHRAEPVQRFTLKLPHTGNFTRALTASGNPVELHTHDDGSTTIALPLDTADAVVLVQ